MYMYLIDEVEYRLVVGLARSYTNGSALWLAFQKL